MQNATFQKTEKTELFKHICLTKLRLNELKRTSKNSARRTVDGFRRKNLISNRSSWRICIDIQDEILKKVIGKKVIGKKTYIAMTIRYDILNMLL